MRVLHFALVIVENVKKNALKIGKGDVKSYTGKVKKKHFLIRNQKASLMQNAIFFKLMTLEVVW